jgi:hypothetical protein
MIMTQAENLQTQPYHKYTLSKLMLIGWVIGLAVILIFVIPGLNHPNPEWAKYWMVRPLIVTPLAGAAAGVWYFLLDYLRYKGGWRTAAAYFLSGLGLLIALWLGIVLGLAGTMWH